MMAALRVSMRPLFLVSPVLSCAEGMCETMFLHFVPVDGV
jgi:hypothetical protein